MWASKAQAQQDTIKPIPVEGITVTGISLRLDRAGFYERQRRGIGKFITRKEIDAANAQFGSDVLRSIPSLKQVAQVNRRNGPRNYTPGRGNCRYRFMVDGSRMMPDFEMDNIPANTIEGIEVYNGLAEVPPAFRSMADAGSAVCGVIAVWTKDGH